MSLDAKGAAALALHRFGLGPRAGSIAAIASDPRGALLAEIERPDAGQVADKDMLSSGQAARLAYNFNQSRQAQQIALRMAEEQRVAGGMQMAATEPKPDEPTMATPQAPTPPPADPAQANVFREIKTRIDTAMNAEIGFAERLVWFWSNHFCV